MESRDEESVESEEQLDKATKFVEIMKKDSMFLRCLPDDLAALILTDPFGIANVFEYMAETKSARLILKCLLILNMRKTHALVCYLCERVYLNHVHYLLHINTEAHKLMMDRKCTVKVYVMWREFVDFFNDEIVDWGRADREYCNGESYYNKVTEEEGNIRLFRPTNDWLLNMKEMTCVFDRGTDVQWKSNAIVQLGLHLDNGIPVCHYCMEAFRSTSEYMRHTLTFRHVEMMQNVDRIGPNIAMKNISLIVNEMETNCTQKEYMEHIREATSDIGESIENCWEHVKSLVPYLPEESKQHRIQMGLGLGIEEQILSVYRDLLKGKTLKDMDEYTDEAPVLRGLLQPNMNSFSPMIRRIISGDNKMKSPFYHVERMKTEEVNSLYHAICRTIDRGLAYCLHCQLIFEDSRQYCDHLHTRIHNEKFSTFSINETNGLGRLHETVHFVIIEFHKRHSIAMSCFSGDPRVFYDTLYGQSIHFYCNACSRPFIDFSYYIAHFWSKSHLKTLPDFSFQDAFVTQMIKDATKEQLSRIKKETIEKFSPNSDSPFLNVFVDGTSTPDRYLTHYVIFHFTRKYEGWRRELMSYKRDMGTPAEYNKVKHVPEVKERIEIDMMMRGRYKRAPYKWWDATAEEWIDFRNYFFTFPPIFEWNKLDSHMRTPSKIPYCPDCGLEFALPDDYYLHFGDENHPFPDEMNTSMAGLSMLIFIMYSERRGVNLDQYKDIRLPY